MAKTNNQQRKQQRRESELERKRLDDREKIALEQRLVEEGKIYPRAHYMPRGRFRGILAVVLAFLLGLILALGGIIGTGAYFGSQISRKPLGDALELLGISSEEYDRYISDEASRLTVRQLLEEASAIVEAFPAVSIGDLEKYSPYIGEAVDQLITQAEELGIELDRTSLTATNFDHLADYMENEVLVNIQLGKVLNLNRDASYLLLALCYGEEGVDYEFEADGSIHVLNEEAVTTVGKLQTQEGVDDLLNSLGVGTMLGLNTGSLTEEDVVGDVMYALAYGNYGSAYTIEEGKIKMLGDHKPTTANELIYHSDDLIQGLEIEALMGPPEANSENIIYYVLYGPQTEDVLDESGAVTDTVTRWVKNADGTVTMQEGFSKRTVADLKGDELVSGLKISDVIDTENADGLLKAIADWTVDDLGDETKIDSLLIGDIITAQEGDSAIVKALSGYSVGELKDQKVIESLRVSDILVVDESSSAFIRTVANWTIGDLSTPSRFNRLKIGKLLDPDAENPSQLLTALSDWRIEDLSKQDKINELNLDDVLDLKDSTGILAALRGVPIGNIQSAIDDLRLSDVLSAEELAGNKILAHLADSTLVSLADDIKGLTIGEVFADQVYSYMEMTDGKTYEDMKNAYFGKTDGTTPNYLKQEYNAETYRPQAVKFTESSPLVKRYLTAGGKVATKGYYVADSMSPVTEAVHGDGKGGFYFEERLTLLPVTEYRVYDYEKGSVGDEAVDTEKYEILSDEFSEYYLDEEGERVDVESVVVSYTTEEGEPYVFAEGEIVRHDHGSDLRYVIRRVPVLERYSDGETLFTEEQVTAHYYYNNVAGEEVELDRYLSGVWYLLLGKNNEAGQPMTETPILEMDGLITDISKDMQDLMFAELWFYGLLESNPYADLTNEVIFPDGITFENGSEERTIRNLIEVKLSETVALINALNSQLKTYTDSILHP